MSGLADYLPLSYGSRGIGVTALQVLLNDRMRLNPRLAADGDFGPRTEAAVLAFQRSHHLAVDGIVGPQTFGALVGASAPRAPPGRGATPAPAPSPGDADWMNVATAEMRSGVQEISGGRANPRIVEYHQTTTLRATSDEVPWCSSFVNWCLLRCGRTGTNSAAAASWLDWGEPLAQPRAGAITVINGPQGNHVGFYLSGGPGALRLLGGNQGDQVKETTFGGSYKLLGYRWPRGGASASPPQHTRPRVDPKPRHGPPPTQGARWFDVALAEKGVHELAGPTANRRIIQYHHTTTYHANSDEVPWCSSFVNWCLIQAGKRGTNSAAAVSWLDWGVHLQNPRLGAITVVRGPYGEHVAFYKSGGPGALTLLGGNQGDQVKYSTFGGSYEILGFRWPR